MSKDFDQLTKEVLALAWCQLNKPLWEGRLEMERFLRENFILKGEKNDKAIDEASGPSICC